MSALSMDTDARRSRGRCPACARQQLEIETGQFVPGEDVDGELHDMPRSAGKRTRSSFSSRSASLASAGTSENSRAQHSRRPADIICNHCLCSHESHEDTGPNSQRCCGMGREGPWDKVCEWCRSSTGCKSWARDRPCPAAGTSEECKVNGRAKYCTHCLCACAGRHPHKFDQRAAWVGKNSDIQRVCGVCLPCWSGWCIPKSGGKRKLIGANQAPEEPFARQWRPPRDADVYVLTGLFDTLSGELPEGSFAHAVFGKSLRYFKGFVSPTETTHVLHEAGVRSGGRSAGIGEAWSGGGSQHPPEKPAGARKIVAAPIRQGPGAERHFGRRHGRRDHNWQWDMMESPWSMMLLQRGRHALGVPVVDADEFEEAGIIAFPGHVVKHKDTVMNAGYGKVIGTLVLRSPESAFVCLQIQGERLGHAVQTAADMGEELPPKFGQKGRFKFAIHEGDAWAMVGGVARNDAEHAVVCGRTAIPAGEPGEGFVRVAFNMRWGWQDDTRV